jgi:hypothetical protein
LYLEVCGPVAHRRSWRREAISGSLAEHFQGSHISSDDTPEGIAHRVDGSDETTLPMLDYLAKRERLAVFDGSLPVGKLIVAAAERMVQRLLEA